MLGFYSYTVILTYLSLASSVTGIFLGLGGHIDGALFCLLFSGLCDTFDGKVARTKKNRTEEEKRFGIQIDSLCDVVCFNVFPAMIGWALGLRSYWQLGIMTFYVLCGVIRLAYFNVMEEIRQTNTQAKRSEYQGLPVTVSSLAVPLFLCFRGFYGDSAGILYSLLLLVMGLLHITPITFRRPGKLGTAMFIVIGAIALGLALLLV